MLGTVVIIGAILSACVPPGYYKAKTVLNTDGKHAVIPDGPSAEAQAKADPKLQPCDEWCQWHASLAWAWAVEEVQKAQFYAVIANQRAERQQDWRLVCIRKGESGNGGGDPWPYIRGYQAKNPSSSASGAYQMLDNTARNLANASGHPEVAGIPARYWPWYIQDEVAQWALNHPNYAGHPWTGTAFCPRL